MTVFASNDIESLVDVPVTYDLAESTSPPLRVADLMDAAELAGITLGYGTSRGEPALRELIAADAGVAPDQVLVTVGAIEAMFLVAQATCRPGDRVLLLAPYFPPARTVPEGLGARVDTVSLTFDDGYRLSLEAVAGALTPRTRLVSLASPQNPSGVRFTDDELCGLVDVVERIAPDALVLVDETYRASTYGDVPVPRSAAAMSPRVVTTSSLSKAHGAPGLRIGWLTTTDPRLYAELRVAKFVGTVACSTVDELLAVRVLERQGEILGARARRLRLALDELLTWARDHPVEIVEPDGGAMCCLRLAATASLHAGSLHAAASLRAGLARRDTRVAPGSWFGEDDRVFRVGFGHLPPADFTSALARLGEALRD